jgi:hypothetical protein
MSMHTQRWADIKSRHGPLTERVLLSALRSRPIPDMDSRHRRRVGQGTGLGRRSPGRSMLASDSRGCHVIWSSPLIYSNFRNRSFSGSSSCAPLVSRVGAPKASTCLSGWEIRSITGALFSLEQQTFKAVMPMRLFLRWARRTRATIRWDRFDHTPIAVWTATAP